ncbi:MAG TPA: hypothetical protein VFP69_00275, partial [Streptomyces sp.]|nr:hypothetical protein [Streptomyces sp.]
MDPDGNLLDSRGTPLQHTADGPGDIVDQPPATPRGPGADGPRVDTPVREPALVGAGTHTAGDAGGVIRLGDDGLTDTGRLTDDPGTPPGHTEGPGGTADHLPANSVDTHAPAGPAGAADNAVPAGPGTADRLPGGGHSDGPGGHPGGPSGHSDGPGGTGPGSDLPPGGGLDDPFGPGDEAAHGAGGLGDDAAGPAHRADEAPGHGGREISVEERGQIQEEHVHKANTDPEWFAEHYDEIGRRRSAERIVDGVELPILTKDANGNWIAKHNLPSGPSEVRFNPSHLGRDTAPAGSLPHLDEAARNRRLSVDLMNAEKHFDDTPSAANGEELARAREAYNAHLRDVPNNSKLSERLGETAARHHVVPREFPGAERVALPKTPNGANMFDDVYRLGDDGDYVIVESKAPSGDLDWRQGKADPDPANPAAHDGGAQGMRVKQGTRPYIRTILAEMTSRGGRDAEIASNLRAALREGKLKYVLVKAGDNPGVSYAGATIEHLKV